MNLLKATLATLLIAVLLIPAALAADPGHSESSIGQGTFETGNFSIGPD